MQSVQQLRFIRRWSVFGKTFQHALRDLVATTFLFLLFLLICAQCGCLTSPIMGTVYIMSYGVGLLWIGQGFLCASVLRSYHTIHSEICRPAIEPQAYEMIEFLVKRFKLWMGLSKTKEFRHKVKFEGMDSLISHSSGNSRPSRFPSPGINIRCTSGTISSFSSEELVLPESPGCDPCNVSFYLEHLPAAVNDLLDHFDRVLKLAEDVCQLETKLEETHRRIKQKGQEKSLLADKVIPLASKTQLGLPRTYSTFSESSLARFRAHRVRISSCSATEGSKQCPVDPVLQQKSSCHAQLDNAPVTANLFRGISACSGHLFKRRPKSEEGQGCQGSEGLQRRVPLKRRAWQTEGASGM
ncbi:polycystin-1-like [Eublepharis macularius]|uniref:Polycystin-1-like n=1 Tax=Eublepharis macularius TaxID=481883 RepID=A0AA97J6A7_EUBMA|nr:polycystin-1-like [Eublepharis macularius]